MDLRMRSLQLLTGLAGAIHLAGASSMGSCHLKETIKGP